MIILIIECLIRLTRLNGILLVCNSTRCLLLAMACVYVAVLALSRRSVWACYLVASLVKDWIRPPGCAVSAVRVCSPTTAVGEGCPLRRAMQLVTSVLAVLPTRWEWAENLVINRLGMLATVYDGPWLWFSLCVL